MSVSIGNLIVSGTGALISNTLLTADNTRRYTTISNAVNTPAYLAIGTGAVYGMGIVLPSLGSSVTFNRDNPNNTFINAIGTANVINLAYQTW
jgi:secreted protein with Ig-like and vWFA domain